MVQLIDYFRILKALMILFLLFVCKNYVPYQNGKVMEEALIGSKSYVMKTTLSCLYYFKITLALLQILQKILSSPLSVCHIKQRVLEVTI